MRILITLSLSCLIIFFFTSSLTAQLIEDNGLRRRLTPYSSVSSPNIFQETSREFVRISTQHRMQPDFKRLTDSLQVKYMQLPFPDKRFISKGVQKGCSPIRKTSSTQSQISVIDTAIVRRLGNTRSGLGDTTRHLYSYSANAKRTSDLTQKLIGNLWVDTQYRTNTYDARNNMLLDFYEIWSNGKWVNDHRSTYTFDANGNQLSELSEYWPNGQPMESQRHTYTYYANGNMLSDLYEGCWNAQWMIYSRDTYTYDANGNMLSDLYESCSDGRQLVISGRNTYTYDTSGNMLLALYDGWQNGQWVNDHSETYTRTYDTNGNKLSELWELRGNSQLISESRDTYEYDVNGNMLSDLYENWSNGKLENFLRHTYTYDTNENMLSDLYEFWQNSQWVIYSRYTFTYDAQKNLTSFWNHIFLDSTWISADISNPYKMGAPISYSVIDIAGNSNYFSGYSFTLTYKTVNTGVASESGKLPVSYFLSQNYPNPFNPSTTITFELPKSTEVILTVYDLLGREVSVLVNEKMNVGIHKVKFDGSNLASGIYFYRLQAGTYINTKKFVLLK